MMAITTAVHGKRHTSVRRLVIALSALAFLITSSPNETFAQGSERTGSVPIFKGTGGERSTLGVKPPPAATALNSLDLKKIVGAPGSVFVTLSPRNPSAVNRGALVFVTPTLVEGGESYAVWGKPSSGKPTLYSQTEMDKIKQKMIDAKMEALGQSPGPAAAQPGPRGSVVLWLRSGANRKFLIDCVVGGSPFLVSGPASDQVIQLNQATGHLIVMLDAATAGWYSFRISSGNEFGWAFYSCEVTNL